MTPPVRRSTRWRATGLAPGGPALERLAAAGDPDDSVFPADVGRPGCDFSFSGLKTAVAQEVKPHGAGALPGSVAADVAAGFQAAVADTLADRAGHAMALFTQRHGTGCSWRPVASRRMA